MTNKIIELAREAEFSVSPTIGLRNKHHYEVFADCVCITTELTKFYTLARADLEAENAKLRDALKKAQGDINWMLNTKQFLSGFVFDYIDEALGETND